MCVVDRKRADVAQLAEQLICNQQVIGSSPIIGCSQFILRIKMSQFHIERPKRDSNPRPPP